MSTILAFDNLKNKYSLYLGKNHMKKFSGSLREHAKNITDFEKEKMLPLTKKELKSHQDAKVCYICRKRFIKKFVKDKNYGKVRDHCHYTGKYIDATHSI